MPDFSAYLRSLVDTYSPQQDCYTLTDLQVEIRIENPAPPGEPDSRKAVKVERFSVLAGLRKYGLGKDGIPKHGQKKHVLLVGKPGSGKSTALQRLLWEEVATDGNEATDDQTDEADGKATDEQADETDGTKPIFSSVSSVPKSVAIPVLVELRSYEDSIEHLIQKFFRRHGVRLSLEAIDDLLFEGRLSLLLDGVNELPIGALAAVESFRKDNCRCPMIFTTRVLDAGAGLGIEQRLEMCALTEAQMREFIQKQFVQKRSPGQADALLRQLKDRLRELAETPLLLEILCKVFAADGQIPKSRGELFRKQFAQQYAEFKRLPELVGDSGGLLPQLMQTLAFEMMQGNDPAKPTQFVLQLPKAIAADKLQQWLGCDREKAEYYLQALLKHHLLQPAADPTQIEFCHQLFQEYYAAEYLLLQLPHLSDTQLQHDYLNLLKWTEPLAMMAALIPDPTQALRLVKLALEVDWMLGARLAGEVKPEFQEQTVGLVSALDVPTWLKVELWGETRSHCAISNLITHTEHFDLDLLWRTVEALGQIGSVEAIPPLLPLLEYFDPDLRGRTVEALGQIVSVEAIPALLPLLEDSDDDVRWRTVEALGQIGSVEAIPALLPLLEDSDDSVRGNAVWALGQIGAVEAIPALLPLLQDSDYHMRLRAGWALGQLRAVEAIPVLLPLLQDSDLPVRRRAAQALGQLRAVEAIPVLLPLLQDSDPPVRRQAAWALGRMGLVEAIPVLLPLLQDSDNAVRWRAAQALGQIRAVEAIPALLPLLQDSDYPVRWQATWALSQIVAVEAIPALLPFLEDPNDIARWLAAKVLGQMGLEEAIPVLLPLLQDSNHNVRRRTAYALGQLRAVEAIPALLKLLEDSDHLVHVCALEALEALEALVEIRAVEAIPALLKLVEHSNHDVRRRAAKVLGQIGSVEAIPALLKLLEHSDHDVCGNAAWALVEIRAVEAIPTLLKLLEHSDDDVRGSAAWALGQMRAVEAIPVLLPLLQDADYSNRQAAEALGQIGSVEAIPTLLLWLQDSNHNVREDAAEMLGNLKDDRAAHILPNLLTLIPTQSGEHAFNALTAIQANCQFYNYEIFEAMREGDRGQETGVRSQEQRTNVFPNATEVKIIEKVEHYHEHPPNPKQ